MSPTTLLLEVPPFSQAPKSTEMPQSESSPVKQLETYNYKGLQSMVQIKIGKDGMKKKTWSDDAYRKMLCTRQPLSRLA
jgi:hypothetical protein